MNIIFGSGIVGLLAKLILGSEWKILPFYRSRFFTYNPALDDNFIIADDELDLFIKDITNSIGPPQRFNYKRAWSLGGELIHKYDAGICDDWLHKIFGADVPSQAPVYMKNRMDLQVYDLRVNRLYYSLVTQYMEELKAEAARGPVTEIGQHYYIRNGVREDFDHAVNTIPLDALCKLMGVDVDLPSKTMHYIHLETPDLNFEGANQLLVADKIFDFWKATNIAPQRYMLYFNNDVVDYGIYLMRFIKSFEILDGTAVEQAIPLGPIPKLSNIEDQAGIFSVGSYAQWDWCMDVGSCILRLLRYAQRDLKPQKMHTMK